MSKVRVYELARDLGLEPAAVAERCRELGIDVHDGHLTTLAAEEAERVKKALRENPATGVTEKRVGSTVVRRRRTDGGPAPAPTPAPAAPVRAVAAAAPATAPAAPVVRRRRPGEDDGPEAAPARPAAREPEPAPAPEPPPKPVEVAVKPPEPVAPVVKVEAPEPAPVAAAVVEPVRPAEPAPRPVEPAVVVRAPEPPARQAEPVARVPEPPARPAEPAPRPPAPPIRPPDPPRSSETAGRRTEFPPRRTDGPPPSNYGDAGRGQGPMPRRDGGPPPSGDPRGAGAPRPQGDGRPNRFEPRSTPTAEVRGGGERRPDVRPDPRGARPAGEAGAEPRRAESNYADREAVNAGGGVAQEAPRERQSFVKVVRTLDAELTQHLINEAQRRAQRSSGPPPRRGPGGPPGPGPGGPPGAGPGPGAGPRTGPPPPRGVEAAPAPAAPGAATTEDPRRKKGKRGEVGSGRVVVETKKDKRFDGGDRALRMRGKRRAPLGKKGLMDGQTVPKASKRVVKMEETITVGELASQLSVKASEIIKALMNLGEMVTVNHVLDLDTVTLIAQEYEFTVENVAFDIENYIPQVDASVERKTRDPVVTVMGHVDHGKTSLLDFIRKTRVAAGEAGGITQHIGAYKVPVGAGKTKRSVVFLDTPGHAAFTEMRARGANVTDVVILVVAADDGVMPQTIEAINHAKAAKVPVVVAINKCDKPDAQPEKIRQQMTEYGLVAEEWGGDTQFVNVSAKTGDGIDSLLEGVLLQADLLELRAVVDRPATGVVIEAELSKGRGPVATILVQEGTLRKGDIVVAGKATGRVRAIIDDRGRPLKEAGPATPVEVLGLNEVPPPSERFFAVKDEKDARTIVSHLEDKDREKHLVEERKRVSLDDLFEQMKSGEVKTLHLIIKSDVQGSLEALKTAFSKLKHPELEVRIIHDAVGAISESDVNLASASSAIIIGFNVRPEKNAKYMAEQRGVEIKLYSVIYNAVDDVKAAMEGMLSPNIEERLIGKAAIRDTFGVPKLGIIAGCAVLQGKLIRNARVRLIRDSRVIADTKIDSLRRFKENVTEVERGHECGAHIENYNDIKVGDELECYELIEVAQKLEI